MPCVDLSSSGRRNEGRIAKLGVSLRLADRDDPVQCCASPETTALFVPSPTWIDGRIVGGERNGGPIVARTSCGPDVLALEGGRSERFLNARAIRTNHRASCNPGKAFASRLIAKMFSENADALRLRTNDRISAYPLLFRLTQPAMPVVNGSGSDNFGTRLISSTSGRLGCMACGVPLLRVRN
jgi:hypothetical protein